mgnify:CR=1 FL=1
MTSSSLFSPISKKTNNSFYIFLQEFFATQVGGVHGVLLSYNERGQSTGIASITFKNSEYANRAIARFNGAPIDNGKSRLRLTLLVDPSRANQNLADRLTGLQGRVGRPTNNQVGRPSGRPLGRGGRPIPTRQQQIRTQTRAPVAPKKKQQQPKREKPVKKSLEDLDKEMADYFDDGK